MVESPHVRVLLVGYGKVNRAAATLAATRPAIDLVGVLTRSAVTDRGDLGPSIPVTTDPPTALALRPDVILVATRSWLDEVVPLLETLAMSRPRAILCTAEELAWVDPASKHGQALASIAREHGIAIVATGVNPGFVLDLWPMVASGLAWDVERIRAYRLSDVAAFGPHIKRQLGIGHTAGSFAAGLADGTVIGHLGFPESLRIIGERMGRPVEDIRTTTEPVFADREFRLSDMVVEAGETIGAHQRAQASMDGTPWVSIELMVHAAPREDGLVPVDEVWIEGRHPIHVRVEPGCAGVLGTAALLVNGIATALAAGPGVHRPGDLPVSVPWLAETPP